MAVPAQGLIFERDDRVIVSTAPGSVYAPIGIVTGDSERRTTGTLVDNCHVLTSRHIFDFTEKIMGRRLRFIASMHGFRERISSLGQVVAAGDRTDAIGTSYPIRSDWLLIRLDRCLGQKLGFALLHYGPFDIGDSLNMRSAGYPVDRQPSDGLSVDPSCQIGRIYADAWANTCAALPGNSGGPLFRIIQKNGVPRLELYAIQNLANHFQKPVQMNPGWDNMATPVWDFGPQIRKFLELGPTS